MHSGEKLTLYSKCPHVLSYVIAIFYTGDLYPSSSKLNELAVLKENYAFLCNTITDVNTLLKYFVTEKIITTDEEEEIKTYTTKSERVSKLLLNISGPLEAGDSNGFYIMLQIMKTHGVNATQHLANQIISRVDKVKLPILVNTRVCNKGLFFVCIISKTYMYAYVCALSYPH